LTVLRPGWRPGPDGRYLAVTNPDGTVYLLRLAAPGNVFQVT
jgi:hypothetical protein